MQHAACSACQKMRKLLIGIANQVGQFWVMPLPPRGSVAKADGFHREREE